MADPIDVDAAVAAKGGADELLRRVVQLHAKVAAPDPERLPLLSPQQLELASAEISWSVKHAIPADSIGVMFGGSGTFKSFIALDYGLHVAHGLRWMGRKTTQGPVIYIAAEGGAGLWRRMRAWHALHGLSMEGLQFYVVPVAVSLLKDASKVKDAANAIGVAPKAVIVDTLSQTFDGEENSATDMGAYLRALGTGLREFWRAVVLVLHHSGHQATERPRGSSAIRANVDFMIGVFRDEKEMLATVEWHKQKDGELHKDATFALASMVLGTDEDGDSITSLAASHLASEDDIQEAKRAELAAGRTGRNGALLALVSNGMLEKDLRKAFYETLETTDPEARKKAFYRARDWAKAAGFIEVADGYIIQLRKS